jgi:TonB family protein
MFGMLFAAIIAESTPAEPPRLVRNVVWSATPTGEDFVRNYPPKAVQLGIDATVIVQCDLEFSGHVSMCKLVSERPAGWGFGDAALKMVTSFKAKPLTADGKPVAGQQVKIPIGFRVVQSGLHIALQCYAAYTLEAEEHPTETLSGKAAALFDAMITKHIAGIGAPAATGIDLKAISYDDMKMLKVGRKQLEDECNRAIPRSYRDQSPQH